MSVHSIVRALSLGVCRAGAKPRSLGVCRAGAKPRSLQLLPMPGFCCVQAVEHCREPRYLDSDMSTTFVPGKARMRLALHARFDQ
jgi:hypothetical protein